MRLKACNLACRRGEKLLFENLSFEIASGEVLVILDANGTGKTSLIRILAGLFPAEEGTIHVQNEDSPPLSLTEVPQIFHYLGHENAVKSSLTVGENIEFWQQLLSANCSEMEQFWPKETARQETELQEKNLQEKNLQEIFALVGLHIPLHLPAGALSHGQLRRLALTRLILQPRPLWLLDEPTANLDAAGTKMVNALINNHCMQGGLVVTSAHREPQINAARYMRLANNTAKKDAPCFG